MNKRSLPIILLLIAVLAGGAFYVATRRSATTSDTGTPEVVTPSATDVPSSEEAGLGAEAYEFATNPLHDAIPEANPLENAVNPFENVYRNPFE